MKSIELIIRALRFLCLFHAVSVHSVPCISVAAGVPVDASTAVGVSTVAGIPTVAGLPSAVDVCDVPVDSAAVSPTEFKVSCEFLLLLLALLLNVVGFFTVVDFPIV
jgi:hypothetical protein